MAGGEGPHEGEEQGQALRSQEVSVGAQRYVGSQKFYPTKLTFFLSVANKEEGGYFEGICDEEIKYDTFTAGKKLTVNVKARRKNRYLETRS